MRCGVPVSHPDRVACDKDERPVGDAVGLAERRGRISNYLEPCCFLRSAQRLRIASAIFLRPSADRRRLRGPVEDADAVRAATLGRPGPRFDTSPVNNARACCSLAISMSISCTRRLKSTIPPILFPEFVSKALRSHIPASAIVANTSTIQNPCPELQIFSQT